MNKFLKDFGLVDLKGLAILKYKKLGLKEEEVMVLLLIHTLKNANFKIITHDLIGQYVSYSKQLIDSILISLVNKQMISVVGTSISLDLFYQKLMFDKVEVSETKIEGVNLVEAFENEFAKALTPMELETLREWKMSGYSDKMILDALKEATLHNAHSFRYIEKILIDWTKNGIKRSGKEKIEAVDDEEFVEYNWWDEDD
ncbi:MAG: DnaD domain protein [Erysipelotrichaceae bacterium]|nr:DnaD domain protein [Erysipelotrichaceae bacterium]